MTTQGKLKPSESQVKEEGTLYHLEKKYFVHKTSTDLKKTVALISGIDIHDCYFFYVSSHSLGEIRINLVCVVLRKPNFSTIPICSLRPSIFTTKVSLYSIHPEPI